MPASNKQRVRPGQEQTAVELSSTVWREVEAALAQFTGQIDAS